MTGTEAQRWDIRHTYASAGPGDYVQRAAHFDAVMGLGASHNPPEAEAVAATDGTREGPLAHFTLNADGTWTQHVDMNPGWDGCPHKEKYLDDEGVAVCTTCGRGGKA